MSRSTFKILCRIDAKTIRGFLNFPDNYPDSGESINDSILAEVYRSCKTEVQCKLLSIILNEGQSLEGLNRILDEREEFLVDRDRGVYDPFLSVRNVSVIKERLWRYNS